MSFVRNTKGKAKKKRSKSVDIDEDINEEKIIKKLPVFDKDYDAMPGNENNIKISNKRKGKKNTLPLPNYSNFVNISTSDKNIPLKRSRLRISSDFDNHSIYIKQKTTFGSLPLTSNNRSYSKNTPTNNALAYKQIHKKSNSIHSKTKTSNKNNLSSANSNTNSLSNKSKAVDIPFQINLVPSFSLIPYSSITIYKDKIIHYSETSQIYQGMYLHIPVAIKIYSKISLLSPQDKENLFSEITLTLSLHHPNILQTFGISHDKNSDSICIIMEKMPESLNLLIKKSVKDMSLMTTELKVSISLQVAYALLYLQTRNPIVLHRDIKSSNILLSDEKNENVVAKLCDFGISKYSSIGKYQTQTQSTLYWMAPEFLAKGIVSEKSDIYSFGILLWEIFMTDTVPFKNVNYFDFLLGDEKILSLRPEIDKNKIEEVPEISKLITSCWNAKDSERPSMEEIVNSLETLNNKLIKNNKQHNHYYG